MMFRLSNWNIEVCQDWINRFRNGHFEQIVDDIGYSNFRCALGVLGTLNSRNTVSLSSVIYKWHQTGLPTAILEAIISLNNGALWSERIKHRQLDRKYRDTNPIVRFFLRMKPPKMYKRFKPFTFLQIAYYIESLIAREYRLRKQEVVKAQDPVNVPVSV